MQLLAVSKFIQYRGPLVARVVGRRQNTVLYCRTQNVRQEKPAYCIGVGMIDADAHEAAQPTG